MLEARWRLANELTDHGKKKLSEEGKKNLAQKLDGRFPLTLTNEAMEALGGVEKGYEEVRKPTPSAGDFGHRFDLASEEHKEWLSAVGTI